MIIWLVVWNIQIILPYIHNNHPNYQLTNIFQRGRSTTNQMIMHELLVASYFAAFNWAKGRGRLVD